MRVKEQIQAKLNPHFKKQSIWSCDEPEYYLQSYYLIIFTASANLQDIQKHEFPVS